ncbi:unnamed protein product [Closterium sp. NIES-65]|nr:unnamed protein product [Closterium sp. NIES-65]
MFATLVPHLDYQTLLFTTCRAQSISVCSSCDLDPSPFHALHECWLAFPLPSLGPPGPVTFCLLPPFCGHTAHTALVPTGRVPSPLPLASLPVQPRFGTPIFPPSPVQAASSAAPLCRASLPRPPCAISTCACFVPLLALLSAAPAELLRLSACCLHVSASALPSTVYSSTPLLPSTRLPPRPRVCIVAFILLFVLFAIGHHRL